jgi:PBP1b-binding outer membrane lipoprotein LpoB
MKGKHWISTVAVVVPLSLALLAGCSKRPREREYGGITPQRVDPSEMSRGAGTGIESQDVLEVTDKMARRILGTPAIAEAAEPPVIGVLPVENNTRFPIQKDLFTDRIRAMLNSKTQGKVRFVARERMESVDLERQLKQEGALSGKPEGMVLGVDYFLTGKLGGLSQAGSTGQSDYVLYTFQLIDANTTEIMWEDYHDIKKEGMEDVIYR